VVDVALGVEADAQRSQNAVERAIVAVLGEPVVDRPVRPIALGHVAPGGPGAELPEDAVERGAVVAAWATGLGGGQQRADGGPLVVGELVASHRRSGEKEPKLSPTEFPHKP